MTIGFAATFLEKEQAAFLIAADRRLSTSENISSDMAIKVYSLGSHVGAVTAGSGLSCATAAELTREVVDDHARLTPDAPVSFYNTARLFAYFLDRVDRQNQWSQGCEVVLAGFLDNGAPVLAKVK